MSPNHDYCIRCGYSEKDAITDNVSNELVDRINRLESILAKLAGRLDTGNDTGNDSNNSSKRRRKER